VAGRRAEGEALLARVGEARLIACDEHGTSLTSRALAQRLARLRDAGERRLVFAIGGADGLDAAVRTAAGETLAFGPQTWPHGLVRAMLAEQVYRAVTILSGAPYHRD
jgi:23S rRNA (pseudouridine1915-N3)-methyltransferase